MGVVQLDLDAQRSQVLVDLLGLQRSRGRRHSGMPVVSMPPGYRQRLVDRHAIAQLGQIAAAAMPVGPEPTTAHLLRLVRVRPRRGVCSVRLSEATRLSQQMAMGLSNRARRQRLAGPRAHPAQDARDHVVFQVDPIGLVVVLGGDVRDVARHVGVGRAGVLARDIRQEPLVVARVQLVGLGVCSACPTRLSARTSAIKRIRSSAITISFSLFAHNPSRLPSILRATRSHLRRGLRRMRQRRILVF